MFVFSRSGGARFRFVSAGRFIADGEPVHPRRTLDTHVLLIGCTGAFPIAVAGEKYLLTDRSYLILPAGTEHYGYAPASGGESHFWCHFSIAEESAKKAPLSLPVSGSLSNPEKYRSLFRQLIDAAYGAYRSPDARHAVCGAYVTILMEELTDEVFRRDEPSTGAGGRRPTVAAACEWIRVHLAEGISPSDVADAFGYNRDYLSQLFRAERGCGLGEYLISRRMERAKELLLSADALPVAEVAHASGFGDEKYFLRVFKRRETVTPSAYRRLYYHVHINKQ